MGYFQSLIRYINPLSRLGLRQYSYTFPLLTSLISYLVSELYAYQIAGNPMAVGTYVIFLSAALIIYFAFRDGILGGLLVTFLTVGYYLEIIYTRGYQGQMLTSGLETTAVLGIIYILVALVIGWLKQTIDRLIEQETDERRRLETIIEQLPIGVIITDSYGKLTQQNQRIGTILGSKFPPDFIFGREALLEGTLNGEKFSSQEAPIVEVLTTKKSIVDREYVVKKKDGSRAFLQVSASVVHNSAGKIIAATEILNDITEQKELDRLKDEFISIASHELKTPITTIKGFTEIMLQQAKIAKQDKFINYLTKMNYQVDRTTALVNELLDVSKNQSGKLDLQKEDILFSSFVKEIIDDLQQINPTHQIIITKNITNEVVYADRYRINQVITNLITNAIKYSPDSDKVFVKVTKNRRYVQFTVKDTGIGISKKDLDYIFDRFFQAKSKIRQSASGLGLGLFIASEIIKRHGGRIWAKSSKGQGSEFFFEIPIKEK